MIAVEGDVDLVTAPQLREALASVPADTKVVVDLCETRFMDSTGLRVLLTANSSAERGIRIACKPAGAIRRLFDFALAGHGCLQIHESREDALASF